LGLHSTVYTEFLFIQGLAKTGFTVFILWSRII